MDAHWLARGFVLSAFWLAEDAARMIPAATTGLAGGLFPSAFLVEGGTDLAPIEIGEVGSQDDDLDPARLSERVRGSASMQ